MSIPLAFLNGSWVPADQAMVTVSDAGFVLGVGIADQLRTFGGKLFRADEHIQRLGKGLQVLGLNVPYSPKVLAEKAHELAAMNYRLLPAGGDLGLGIVVTPGTVGTISGTDDGQPWVCMHTYPLPFHRWAKKYELGQSLVTTPIPMIPADCWPSDIKCRSRLHYYLADRLAQQREPGSRALLLNSQGFVREISTANILLIRRHGPRWQLVSPPLHTILPGITLSAVREWVCTWPDWEFIEEDFPPDSLLTASEVWLTSTPWCVLPVTRFNGHPLPIGPHYSRLLQTWLAQTGIDISTQASSLHGA